MLSARLNRLFCVIALLLSCWPALAAQKTQQHSREAVLAHLRVSPQCAKSEEIKRLCMAMYDDGLLPALDIYPRHNTPYSRYEIAAAIEGTYFGMADDLGFEEGKSPFDEVWGFPKEQRSSRIPKWAKHFAELDRLLNLHAVEIQPMGANRPESIAGLGRVRATLLKSGYQIPELSRDQFDDVPKTHWAATAIRELRFQWILFGYPSSKFSDQQQTVNGTSPIQQDSARPAKWASLSEADLGSLRYGYLPNLLPRADAITMIAACFVDRTEECNPVSHRVSSVSIEFLRPVLRNLDDFLRSGRMFGEQNWDRQHDISDQFALGLARYVYFKVGWTKDEETKWQKEANVSFSRITKLPPPAVESKHRIPYLLSFVGQIRTAIDVEVAKQTVRRLEKLVQAPERWIAMNGWRALAWRLNREHDDDGKTAALRHVVTDYSVYSLWNGYRDAYGNVVY